MMSRRSFRSVTVASLLVLAACGGGSDETADEDVAATPPATEAAPSETTPEPEPTLADVAVESSPEEEAEPVETEPVETEPADTAPVTEPPPDEEADGSDGSCLVGEWIVTEDEMNAYYDAIETSFPEGPAPTFDITGNVLLTFTETDYIYVADFTLALEIVGQIGTGDAMGTVSGTWDVVDGLVVTTLGSSDLEVVVSVGGVTFDGTEFANGLLDDLPINDAEFDCAGPTISFLTPDAEGDRHDVLLTPA